MDEANTIESNIIKEIQNRLIALSDEKYKAFNSKLIPNIDLEKQLGVRVPDIKKLAAELMKSSLCDDFMHTLPHDYHDENMLHACMINLIKNDAECYTELERFLPYVDNWAVCDVLAPKVLARDPDRLLEHIKQWLKKDMLYTKRFAVGMLMRFYLDERFDPEYLVWVAGLCSDEYYLNMMCAWYFATALAKQYDAAITYIEQHRLNTFVHNKTIQKAIESFRVPDDKKNYLRTLKIK